MNAGVGDLVETSFTDRFAILIAYVKYDDLTVEYAVDATEDFVMLFQAGQIILCEVVAIKRVLEHG